MIGCTIALLLGWLGAFCVAVYAALTGQVSGLMYRTAAESMAVLGLVLLMMMFLTRRRMA